MNIFPFLVPTDPHAAAASKPNSAEQKTSSEAGACISLVRRTGGGSRLETKFFLSQTFISPSSNRRLGLCNNTFDAVKNSADLSNEATHHM